MTSACLPRRLIGALSQGDFSRFGLSSASLFGRVLLAAPPQPGAVLQFPPGSYLCLRRQPGWKRQGCIRRLQHADQRCPPGDPNRHEHAASRGALGRRHHDGHLEPRHGQCPALLWRLHQLRARVPHPRSRAGDASNDNRQRDYVVTVSSWLDESLFGRTFADASALTHEIAEAYNDPFTAFDAVQAITPWRTDPTGSICQDNLEVGDMIEFLPNQI